MKDPTRVHILIIILRSSYTDYFHEYLGRALARFELSTLPEHKGTRTIVLRFLKMITPVKCVIPNYDGHIFSPKEGELHRRSNRYTNRTSDVWCLDIDKQGMSVRCFQLLWDA